MKKTKVITTLFKSKLDLAYIVSAGMILFFWLGYIENGPYVLNADFFQTVVVAFAGVLVILFFDKNTYLSIENNKTLVNSGYFSFGSVRVDIFKIKYIYRYPHVVMREWGSRMVIYLHEDSGKLVSTAVREVNYTSESIELLLKSLKQINPSIELDPEYEEILLGKRILEDASKNTVSGIEAKLKAKGEVF